MSDRPPVPAEAPRQVEVVTKCWALSHINPLYESGERTCAVCDVEPNEPSTAPITIRGTASEVVSAQLRLAEAVMAYDAHAALCLTVDECDECTKTRVEYDAAYAAVSALTATGGTDAR